MRLQQVLEKYLPLIGNMLVPAFIFAAGLLSFLVCENFSVSTAKFFNILFYILTFLGVVVLLNFNRGRPLFFITAAALGYILLNALKHKFGADFASTVYYRNLAVLMPFNLLVFYLFSPRRFISDRSLAMLVVLLIEYSVGELLGRGGIEFAFSYWGINIPSAVGFLLLVNWLLVAAVKSGDLADYSLMFASLCIGCGFYYASSASGVSMFFALSQLITVICVIYKLLYNRYYDELTGFYSRDSYLLQSRHFPLKYTLAIISIDNYERLATVVGAKKCNIIVKLIAGVLSDETSEETVYRYAPDRFIVLYKKLDKKETVAAVENIRRLIAGLSFAASVSQKPVKLTVSCSVAEKKRSDSGAVEVLLRADKAMRNTLKFSHNVTSQG